MKKKIFISLIFLSLFSQLFAGECMEYIPEPSNDLKKKSTDSYNVNGKTRYKKIDGNNIELYYDHDSFLKEEPWMGEGVTWDDNTYSNSCGPDAGYNSFLWWNLIEPAFGADKEDFVRDIGDDMDTNQWRITNRWVTLLLEGVYPNIRHDSTTPGTSPENFVEGVEENLPVGYYIHRLHRGRDLENILNPLSQGYPVIAVRRGEGDSVAERLEGGHFVTILGYKDGNLILTNGRNIDSVAGDNIFRFSEFQEFWKYDLGLPAGIDNIGDELMKATGLYPYTFFYINKEDTHSEWDEVLYFEDSQTINKYKYVPNPDGDDYDSGYNGWEIAYGDEFYNTCVDELHEVKYNPDKCAELWNEKYPNKDYDYLYIDFHKEMYDQPEVYSDADDEAGYRTFYQEYKCYFRGMKEKSRPWLVPVVTSVLF